MPRAPICLDTIVAVAVAALATGCSEGPTVPDSPTEFRLCRIEQRHRGDNFATVPPYLDLTFDMWEDELVDDSDATLFYALRLQDGDEGRVVPLPLDGIPYGPSGIARLMSDDMDGTIHYRVRGLVGTVTVTGRETQLIESAVAADPGPGFAGARITRIELTVETFQIDTPVPNPTGGADLTKYDITWRVDVFAAIP